MPIVAKLDEYGKGAWIAFAVLGFIIFWPLGLATLAFLFWSGRMGCGMGGADRYEHRMNRLQSKMERLKERMGGRHGGFGGGWGGGPSSGNRAFDEYRMETLRRLEEEQSEFRNFLDRLRHAKDKEEFDAFMAQHKQRPTPPNDQPQQG